MKFTNVLRASILLFPLISFSIHAQANTTKVEEKATIQKKQIEKNLKQFNENVAITLTGRNIVTLEDNKTVIVIRYEIINKSKNKSIKSVNWLSGYTFNEQIIATQNMQIDFNPILKAKEKISIETNIPLEQIPSHARHIFASPDAPIGLITGAKKLEFTKGKPIIIE